MYALNINQIAPVTMRLTLRVFAMALDATASVVSSTNRITKATTTKPHVAFGALIVFTICVKRRGNTNRVALWAAARTRYSVFIFIRPFPYCLPFTIVECEINELLHFWVPIGVNVSGSKLFGHL